MKTYLNGLTSAECDTPGGGEVMTKQDGKDAADINKILANFKRTGDLSSITSKEPIYGDFSTAIEYDQALQLVRDTQAAFATWPAELRDAAANDPLVALNMISDEGGRAVLEKAGLVVKGQGQETAEPVTAPVTPATP